MSRVSSDCVKYLVSQFLLLMAYKNVDSLLWFILK